MNALMLSMSAGRADFVTLMRGDLGYAILFLAAAGWMFFRAIYILRTEPIADRQYSRD